MRWQSVKGWAVWDSCLSNLNSITFFFFGSNLLNHPLRNHPYLSSYSWLGLVKSVASGVYMSLKSR